MLGLLSAGSSVLGQGSAGGGLGGLGGGGSTDASMATSSVSQTFSTGSFGGGLDTNTLVIGAVVIAVLYFLVLKR